MAIAKAIKKYNLAPFVYRGSISVTTTLPYGTVEDVKAVNEDVELITIKAYLKKLIGEKKI